jgi:UDP-3-O-[3-hydroxymyristoyl] glucosamine N-acyltransferase
MDEHIGLEMDVGFSCDISNDVIFLKSELSTAATRIIIGNNVIIRAGTIIYSGVRIGSNVTIDHYCVIREGVEIGESTRIMNYTEINRDVRIGKFCRIAGYLANRVRIGNNTSSFGYLVHEYPCHGGGIEEASPHVGDNVIIGRLAVIAGNVKIHNGTKVRAGSLITEKRNEAD